MANPLRPPGRKGDKRRDREMVRKTEEGGDKKRERNRRDR